MVADLLVGEEWTSHSNGVAPTVFVDLPTLQAGFAWPRVPYPLCTRHRQFALDDRMAGDLDNCPGSLWVSIGALGGTDTGHLL
ncbi:MAG: hypothetical protein QNM02_11515 [Acidimicrobiia bacterium]|nr:hypothetical protein [Acidimicrobiia bacterium]